MGCAACCRAHASRNALLLGNQCTCFTSTKAHILTRWKQVQDLNLRHKLERAQALTRLRHSAASVIGLWCYSLYLLYEYTSTNTVERAQAHTRHRHSAASVIGLWCYSDVAAYADVCRRMPRYADVC
jgi:hypothetical protein